MAENWQKTAGLTLLFLSVVNAGIRTPPARILEQQKAEENHSPSTSTLISNQGKEESNGIPIVTNRRYLQKTIQKNRTASLNLQSHLEKQTNSEKDIFSKYKASNNYIINNFLRKNIPILLENKLPRILPPTNSFQSKNTIAKNFKESKGYPVSYYHNKNNFLSKLYDKIHQDKLEEYLHGGHSNYKNRFPFLVETSTDSVDVLQSNSLPIVIINAKPVGNLGNKPGYNKNKAPEIEAVKPTEYFNSLKWRKNNSLLNFQTKFPEDIFSSTFRPHLSMQSGAFPAFYPYDPADPDPFYDIVSDIPAANNEFQQQDGGSYMSTYIDSSNSSEKLESTGNVKSEEKCPNVKVTLTEKVSLNVHLNSSSCNDFKVDVNSDAETTTTKNIIVPEKQNSAAIDSNQKSPASHVHSASTQIVPLFAEISHGEISSSGTHHSGASNIGSHFHKHKNKKKKRRNKKGHKKPESEEHIKLTTSLKYIMALLAKFFAIFTIANPLTFSFWIMMFSPLAVLLAGGVGLAMIIYPFASAALTSAYRPYKKTPSTVVIHRHRYVPPPKWKRYKQPPRPVKPWKHFYSRKLLDRQDSNQYSEPRSLPIPINEQYLDETFSVVTSSLKNFEQQNQR